MTPPRHELSRVDRLRFDLLGVITTVPAFRNTWPDFRDALRKHLTVSPTARGVFELGNHLSEVFRSARDTSRSQSGVSSAGTNWECLAVLYLNMVLFGSDTVAVRYRTEHVPRQIRDALAVTIQNSKTNSESDVVVYSIPDVDNSRADRLTMVEIENLIGRNPSKCRMGVIQTKTNWNENAQIPMLWDMVYRSNREGGSVGRARVGASGFHPGKFGAFSYAFLTVPTTRGTFKPQLMPVLRVSNLSGGNYWGLPSKNGVARGFAEYVPSNFDPALDGSSEAHIERHLLREPTILERFLALDFAD